MKYNLLLFSKTEVVYLQKINEKDVLKSILLFCSRNEHVDIHLYEYSKIADYEDDFFEILHLFK